MLKSSCCESVHQNTSSSSPEPTGGTIECATSERVARVQQWASAALP
jgi:hypothetical protein